MILADRHYVALGRRTLRRHLVFKTVWIPSGGRGQTLRYEIVGRHFTHRGAAKRARILNAQSGRAH